MSFKSAAIFSDHKLLKNRTLDFLDIGARGDLPTPWRELEAVASKRIRVTGFEPDKREADILMQKFPNRNYFATGLGATDGTSSFYLNNGESTSSIYKPNHKLASLFDRSHFQYRQVKEELNIAIKTLDALPLEHLVAPFMKIDVQGAELDILKGGSDFMSNKAIGFSAESWTQDVYKGQSLTKDIMEWAHDHQFTLYGIEETGRWSFASNVKQKCKGIPVCIDLLYFKDIECYLHKSPSDEEIINFALILDLWGFPGAALRLTEGIKDENQKNSLEKLISTSRVKKVFRSPKLNDFWDRVRAKIGITPTFPPLH